MDPTFDRRSLLLAFGSVALGARASGSAAARSPQPRQVATVDLSGGAKAGLRARAELVALGALWNGTWKGRWVSDRLGTGTSTGVIAIELKTGNATLDLSFTGRVFGAAVPATRYVLRPLASGVESPSFSSPQLGAVSMQKLTGHSFELRATPTAGAKSVLMAGQTRRGRLDITYDVTLSEGTVALGACTWTRNGAVVPPVPTRPVAVESGNLACALLPAPDLQAALGPGWTQEANGGKADFRPGLDVSHCYASRRERDSGDDLSWSYYRGTPAAAAAYWPERNGGLPEKPTGLGEEAGATIGASDGYLAVRQGGHVIELALTLRSVTDGEVIRSTLISVARIMLANALALP